MFKLKENGQWNLYLCLFLPVVIFSIILASGLYQFDLNARLRMAQADTEHHVELQVRSISQTFRQITEDLKYLSNQQGLLDFLDEQSTAQQQSTARDYQVFSQQKKIYDQIRFLDNTGLERIRVNYNNGAVQIVSDHKLQNKGKRYYFMDAYKLAQGEIFVSPFDLNIENGQVEQPLKPMIRFGMPVFDRQGKKRGIVLLNYLGQDLLTRFRETANDLAGTALLINRDGFLLSSDNPRNDWAFMYPERRSESFASNNKSLWQKLVQQSSGQLMLNGKLITFDTVLPLSVNLVSSTGSTAAYASSSEQIASKDYSWKVVFLMNKDNPALSSKNSILMLLSFTLLVTIVSLLGTWALTHSRSKLTKSASKLAEKVNELEKTRDHLIQSEKMASLGRMVAGFAHEINTPVGIAVAATSQIELSVTTLHELLQQDEVEEDDLFQEMNTLQESTRLTLSNLNRAANLIGSFKRSSVDQTSNKIRSFLPHEIIHDLLSSLKNKLKRTDIQINISCPDQLKIKSQPGLVEQLLTNLILNSFIHAFDNGTASGKIDISITIEKDQLYIIYKDDGKGMTQETQEKIFEPFFTTDHISGTGLGLYLCYNIVTAELNGEINCDSRLGQGTRYDVSFPVRLVD